MILYYFLMMLMYVNQEIKTDLRFYRGANHEQVENSSIFATTAMFYLDDVTEELGPTKIIPGSHKAGRVPDGDTTWNGQEPQSILCNAGDVVTFRSEIWHRGSRSTSSDNRYLLQVFYSNRMVTQKFPPYPHGFRLNKEILAQATPRQLRLLGSHDGGVYD